MPPPYKCENLIPIIAKRNEDGRFGRALNQLALSLGGFILSHWLLPVYPDDARRNTKSRVDCGAG